MGDVCRQQGWGLVAILFCVATPGWSVPATTQPESTFTVESQAVDGVATIHCLGNPLFRLRGAGSVDRAGSVVQALRSAFFSARVLPPEVSVADERPPVVCVGEHPVVTVTREDAGANDTEPKALAEVWRENLSAAFERWSRKPLPGKLTVPLGGALGWRLASGTGDLRGVRLDP